MIRKNQNLCNRISKITRLDGTVPVRDTAGILVDHSTHDLIFSKNKKLKETSQKKFVLSRFASQKYTHIQHFPFMKDHIHNQDSMLSTIYSTIHQEQFETLNHKNKLAAEYVERRALWLNLSNNIDQYHKEHHETINLWPKEFSNKDIKFPVHQICGYSKDQPLLSDKERELYSLYDENSLVTDPVKEHNMYKNQVTWTEEEKKIFLERYANNPRDFRKISLGLPSKSQKNIIEFYYLNRHVLNLKSLEIICAQKRSKKRYISEGSQSNSGNH